MYIYIYICVVHVHIYIYICIYIYMSNTTCIIHAFSKVVNNAANSVSRIRQVMA